VRALPTITVLGVLAGWAGPASSAAPVRVPGAPDCPIFPSDNAWNTRIDKRPVAGNSAQLIRSIGIDNLHPDFGTRYGIPYVVVGKETMRTRPSFDYADESDRVGYPIPPNPPIEDGGDRHIIMVERDSCRLYELYAAQRRGSGWHAGSGAVWNLRSNKLRPRGWTSADAAGLPILPGLARPEEASRGAIRHALRFTVAETRRKFIFPARHFASSSDDPSLPPMGLRLRLRSGFKVGGFPRQTRSILVALKRYGMILADNGSDWFISGAKSPKWDDRDIEALKRVSARDFEVVAPSG
jgi:hypothetical protein